LTKKITISVPDELHEKMEKWKDSFNFSKVFQDAISEAIQKKENFQKRLTEVSTMEQVIERLKKEKTEAESDYFEQGKGDGLDWAKTASYEDLLYGATKFEPINEFSEHFISYDPERNEVLGDYFKEIIEENESMGFIETMPGNWVPNEFFNAWEEGWATGIREFWAEIQDKL